MASSPPTTVWEESSVEVKRGYSNEIFTRPPPKKLKCVICSLVLRNVHQSNCCGSLYCKACCEERKSMGKPCPSCNDRVFPIFHDRKVQLKVDALRVKCCCGWEGELQRWESVHIDTCEARVKCSQCNQEMFHRTLKVHKPSCPRRKYTCEYCHQCSGIFEEVRDHHFPKCGRYPVLCPNHCVMTLMPQGQLTQHLWGCPAKGRVDDLKRMLRERTTEVDDLKQKLAIARGQLQQLEQKSNTGQRPERVQSCSELSIRQYSQSLEGAGDRTIRNGKNNKQQQHQGLVQSYAYRGERPRGQHDASGPVGSKMYRNDHLSASVHVPCESGGFTYRPDPHAHKLPEPRRLPGVFEECNPAHQEQPRQQPSGAVSPLEKGPPLRAYADQGGQRQRAAPAQLLQSERVRPKEQGPPLRAYATDHGRQRQRVVPAPAQLPLPEEARPKKQLPRVLPIPHTCLEWIPRASLPTKMFEGQAVHLGDHVYVGGGKCPNSGNVDYESTVFLYSLPNDSWDSLPPLNHHRFALVAHNGMVFAIGGVVPGRDECTNIMCTWDDDQLIWNDKFRRLNVPRMQATAVSHSGHIAIAGGKGPHPLSSVEIYMDDDNSWHEVSPLPSPLFSSSSAVLNGQWYLLGGPSQGRAVFSVSLNGLVREGRGRVLGEEVDHEEWKRLPMDVDYECASAVSIGNAVLAVGGKDWGSCKDVVGFFPDINVWRPVKHDLPHLCFSSCAVAVSETEVMVIGGRTRLWKCDDVYTGRLVGLQ